MSAGFVFFTSPWQQQQFWGTVSIDIWYGEVNTLDTTRYTLQCQVTFTQNECVMINVKHSSAPEITMAPSHVEYVILEVATASRPLCITSAEYKHVNAWKNTNKHVMLESLHNGPKVSTWLSYHPLTYSTVALAISLSGDNNYLHSQQKK